LLVDLGLEAGRKSRYYLGEELVELDRSTIWPVVQLLKRVVLLCQQVKQLPEHALARVATNIFRRRHLECRLYDYFVQLRHLTHDRLEHRQQGVEGDLPLEFAQNNTELEQLGAFLGHGLDQLEAFLEFALCNANRSEVHVQRIFINTARWKRSVCLVA